MKKTLVTLFLICFSIMVNITVFAQTGVIQEMSGTVELKPSGATTFVPANVGDQIARNTIVSTGFKSTAKVAVGNSIVTIRPLTRLSLAELQSSANTETINIQLAAGRVRADVRAPEGGRTNFSVQSPTATASVRGTTIEFDSKNLRVLEGNAFLSGRKGVPMLVSAGSQSIVESSGKPVDPIIASAVAFIPPRPVGRDATLGTRYKTPKSTGGDLDIGLDYSGSQTN